MSDERIGWRPDGPTEMLPVATTARVVPTVVNGFGRPVETVTIQVPTYRLRQRWVRTYAEVEYTEWNEDENPVYPSPSQSKPVFASVTPEYRENGTLGGYYVKLKILGPDGLISYTFKAYDMTISKD